MKIYYKLNKDKKFKKIEMNIPYYIFEEIVDYIEETAKGKCKTMKWNNIKRLLNMTVMENRLTKEQVNYIKEKYCRED